MNKSQFEEFLKYGFTLIDPPVHTFDLDHFYIELFDFFLMGNSHQVSTYQRVEGQRYLFHVGKNEKKLPPNLYFLRDLYHYLNQFSISIIDQIGQYSHLPEKHFEKKTNHAASFLRPTLYWGKEGEITSDTHNDTSLITVIFASTHDGLEVLQKNGEWKKVSPMKNKIVVQSGSLLEELSNGLIPASQHRVKAVGEEVRISFPFFLHGNDNALMEKFNLQGLLPEQKKILTYKQYLNLKNKLYYLLNLV